MTAQELHNIRERHDKVKAFLSKTAPDQAEYVEMLSADVATLLGAIREIPPPIPDAA